MKQYLEVHRKLIGLAAACTALIIAIVYLYVTPQEALSSSGVQQAIITYGHSLCWALLGAASFVWALEMKRRVSMFLVYLAAATYGIFIAVSFL